jgi:hypothetical protein
MPARFSSAPAFSCYRYSMNVRWSALILGAALVMASCSRKAEPAKAETHVEETEDERQPPEDEIAQDCLAFVRATKILPQPAGGDCPGCSREGSEVLAFREMRMDRVSCSASSCEIAVTLRAAFNPAPAGTMTGGLTAWISQAQRLEYLNGRPPQGDQLYRVKIIYKRTGAAWRAIEFDKADPQ